MPVSEDVEALVEYIDDAEPPTGPSDPDLVARLDRGGVHGGGHRRASTGTTEINMTAAT
jgi:hypothetical protein